MRVKRVLPSGVVAYVILCNLLLIFLNYPMFSHYLKTPDYVYYPMVHHGVEDYYLYLSTIRESKEGAWMTPALFTAEDFQPSIIYNYFIFSGKVAAIFNLTPAVTYHLGRIISTELIIVTTYLICQAIVGKRKAFWAAAIGMFSTIPIWMMYRLPDFKFMGFTDWLWTVSAVGRLDHLSHHAFGIACMYLTVIILLKFAQTRRSVYAGISTLGAFISAIFYPPTGLALFLGVIIAGLTQLIRGLINKTVLPRQWYLGLSAISIGGFLGLLIMKLVVMKGFPWSQWTDYDVNFWNHAGNVNGQILESGSLMVLLSLPAILFLPLKIDFFTRVFLSAWIFIPYAMLPFNTLLGISRYRMIHMGNFIPLGIMVFYTVEWIGRKLRFRRFIYMFFTLVFIATTVPVTYVYFKMRTNLPLGYINIDIPMYIVESFEYIHRNVPKYSVVLAETGTADMIPAFAPVKIYYGHPTQTKDYLSKAAIASDFYSGLMTDSEAYDFIKNNNIQYIYSGPLEHNYGGNILRYGLPLTEMYAKNDITIFKVKRDAL